MSAPKLLDEIDTPHGKATVTQMSFSKEGVWVFAKRWYSLESLRSAAEIDPPATHLEIPE